VRMLRWGGKYVAVTSVGGGAGDGVRDSVRAGGHEHPEDGFTRLYRRVMGPLLRDTLKRDCPSLPWM
jgi:hypothetical protein